mmetsp:Transcript_15616/g.42055  ORF Transcript_15616/g.42055 Transcript_15616/m.42055 type:complete len:219 (+) Transcript_15616:2094-2750(+)
MLRSRHVDAGHEQQVAQADSRPDVRADGTRPPTEADGLFRHVLFFATVSGTHERDRKRDAWKRSELVHRQRHRVAHQSRNRDLMGVPLQTLHRGTVVANVMDRGRSEKALIQKRLDVRGLHVERVLAGQPRDQLRAWHPLVRRVHVFRQNFRLDVLEAQPACAQVRLQRRDHVLAGFFDAPARRSVVVRNGRNSEHFRRALGVVLHLAPLHLDRHDGV